MEEIKEMFAQIQEKLSSLEEKMDNNMEVIRDLKEENEKLKQTIKQQDERIESIEREIRKKNVIIKGVEDKEDEKPEEREEKVKGIFERMGMGRMRDEEMTEIRRIGAFSTGKKRPLLVKFKTWDKKMEMYSHTKNLKGSEVWIDEDYTKAVQERRKYLIPIMKEARQKGQRAILKHDKLIVNGEKYGCEDFGNMDKEKQEGQKRTASERSPGGNNEQIRKILRTEQKNC